MRTQRYAATGAILGLGAPLGLLVLRRLAGAADRGRLRNLTYLYVTTSTSAVFALFGWMLGRRADELVEGHRKLDRLREEFSAVVAHDLTGPVAALRTQVQLLLGQQQADELHIPRSVLERIAHGSDGLMEMIRDLTDASGLESKRLSLERKSCDLGALTSEIVERQRAALAHHPIELRTESSPSVFLDPNRFAQILTNLLDNAAKYSDLGTPIRLSVEPSAGGVALRVQDQGSGIDPEELPFLFDRFYQSKRSRARKTGLGLGLYIVRGLVEAQGGRVSVSSQPGHGSTFTVWFPAEATGR